MSFFFAVIKCEFLAGDLWKLSILSKMTTSDGSLASNLERKRAKKKQRCFGGGGKGHQVHLRWPGCGQLFQLWSEFSKKTERNKNWSTIAAINVTSAHRSQRVLRQLNKKSKIL